MNKQMRFKKVALSALLVSAVAVPTAANAASGAKDVTKKASSVAGASVSLKGVPAAKVTTAATVTAIGWADPLALAKTYAPDTGEDWKSTLDNYYKAAGFSLTVAALADSVPAELIDGVVFAKEISPAKALPIGTIEAGRNLELVVSDDIAAATELASVQPVAAIPASIAARGEVFTLSNAEGASTISFQEPSEADKALFKAQDDLFAAAKTKDATTIKDALAKLLNQYKEQIKVLEAAK